MAMTESEWWSATDPEGLIDWLFFDALASEPKCRAFAIACCRRVEHLVQHKVVIQTLSALELVTTGCRDATEVEQLADLSAQAIGQRPSGIAGDCPSWDAADAILAATMFLDPNKRKEVWYRDREWYDRIQPGPYPLMVAESASGSRCTSLLDEA